MDVKEWQQRLVDSFSVGGTVGAPLLEVMEAETDHKGWVVSSLVGHHVLIESFQAFMLNTCRLAEDHYRSRAVSAYEHYLLFLLEVCGLFRGIRSTEILFQLGYPMGAYSLLRDLKTRTMFLAAIGLRYTTQNKLTGIDGISESDLASGFDAVIERVRSKSMSEERVVLDRLFRNTTDIRETDRDRLLGWERLFHREVHGGQLSSARLITSYVRGEIHLPLTPLRDPEMCSLYLNRVGEICWMLLRILPLLQREPAAFGQAWETKWEILDDSFRVYERGLRGLDKPVLAATAEVIERFLDLRFPFRASTHSYADCLE